MTNNIDDDTTSMIGRRLGRYTCLRALGAGGMAVVYLARRTGAKGFTKVFALKRVKPQYAADPNFSRMFMHEANLSASLDHPNIAQVVDFGQDGPDHFLVMEYVHGPDLRMLLRRSEGGRLPLACAIAVLTRVCAALHYAHDKTQPDGTPLELVHRDVSPTNVLLSIDGAVKLTDFGIAKGFGDDVSGTRSGSLVGKPGYMSPEQVRCETLDRRSDVFSLGILLYEMTTGHRCFFGDSVFAVLNATQRASFALPSQRDPDYPAPLEEIVVKALRPQADERFASARELQHALEEFALDRRIRASDTALCDYLATLDLNLEDPASVVLPQVPSGTEVRDAGGTAFMLSGRAPEPAMATVVSPVPRSRTLWWVGVALAVGVVGATALRAGGSDAPPPRSPEATPVVTTPTPAKITAAPREPAIPAAAPPAEASAESGSAPTPEIQPVPVDAPKRGKKRRRPSKPSTPAASDLDALAPPSRRGE